MTADRHTVLARHTTQAAAIAVGVTVEEEATNMSELSDRLETAEMLNFGNPVNYAGPYYQNTISVIRKSDFDFFQPYIRAARSDRKKDAALAEEVRQLPGRLFDRLFFFDAGYSYVLPDKVLESAEQIHKYFVSNHHILIGPQCKYSGQYIHRDGDVSDRNNIFNELVTTANYKFFGRSSLIVEGVEFFVRMFRVEGEYDLPWLTVYPRKMRGILLGIYNSDDEDNDEYHDILHFFDQETGEFDYESGIIFAKDVDDDEEVEREIEDWVHEYVDPEDDNVTITVVEDERGSPVKLDNALTVTIDL
jgi:hypothetical protein